MTKEYPEVILYADDNPHDARLFLFAAEEIELEYRVDIVENGQEALNYLNYEGKYATRVQEMPAAILLDIKMPKLNGIEALKAIRSKPEFQETPVIMITSSEMLKDITICYEQGASAYVVKPIDFDDFVQLVGSMSRFWTTLNNNRKLVSRP